MLNFKIMRAEYNKENAQCRINHITKVVNVTGPAFLSPRLERKMFSL